MAPNGTERCASIREPSLLKTEPGNPIKNSRNPNRNPELVSQKTFVVEVSNATERNRNLSAALPQFPQTFLKRFSLHPNTFFKNGERWYGNGYGYRHGRPDHSEPGQTRWHSCWPLGCATNYLVWATRTHKKNIISEQREERREETRREKKIKKEDTRSHWYWCSLRSPFN